MRVTSKGQVTIPAEMRKLAGLQPNSDVEFAFRDGELILRRAGGKTRGQALVERLRGAFETDGRSADDILRETRGDD